MRVLFFAFALAFSATQAFSQPLPQKVAAAKLLLQSYGYQILDTKSCDLTKGQMCYFDRLFYSSNQYIVVAVVEDGVYDLDMYAYDSAGYMYQQDETFGDVAAIVFDKYINDRLTVYVKNVNCYNRAYSYDINIIVAYK